jgi:hypothetical protein
MQKDSTLPSQNWYNRDIFYVCSMQVLRILWDNVKPNISILENIVFEWKNHVFYESS